MIPVGWCLDAHAERKHKCVPGILNNDIRLITQLYDASRSM